MAYWLDTITAPIAPIWTLRRQRARVSSTILHRHFEAAASGRRTSGWTRTSGDANAANAGAIANLRNIARDLVRNNAYAASALSTIVDHAVGWGIVAKPSKDATRAVRNQASDRWKRWAETTACDADGRHDLAGLQKLVMGTVVESGECLIRRRIRRPEDGLPIPLQLQVLEPDYLDSTRDGMPATGGVRTIQGVIFDPIGRRIAYQLFREHPGSAVLGAGYGQSDRIPATDVLHVFKSNRPGQIRGTSWFAPVALKLKDFDDYEDAALMKQKIAACLAVMTSDVNGDSPALGATDATTPEQDFLEPGLIMNLPPGRNVTVVDPPAVTEHSDYSKTVLRAIATGIGVTYEDLCGDYSGMPFSAARMSRLRHWARVEDWRWRMLIPQFCDPVWAWAMQAAVIAGMQADTLPTAEWTCPPAPMIDPSAEGLAYARNIRAGIMTLSEAIRERGYSPEELLNEYADDNKRLDTLGIVLDSDARKMTQAGQLQGTPQATAPAPAVPSMNGNGAYAP